MNFGDHFFGHMAGVVCPAQAHQRAGGVAECSGGFLRSERLRPLGRGQQPVGPGFCPREAEAGTAPEGRGQ